jgi:UDP-glucose 4-epimerase
VVDITIESSRDSAFDNQILNVGTGKKTTVGTILNLIKKYSGSTKEIEITDGTPGDQFGIYADNHKLLSLYDKELISFEDGLQRMILWIKDNSEATM